MRDENAVEGETRDGGIGNGGKTTGGEEMGMLFGEVTNRGGAKLRGRFDGEGEMVVGEGEVAVGEGGAERRATKAEEESEE